jgi:hypothetical protein
MDKLRRPFFLACAAVVLLIVQIAMPASGSQAAAQSADQSDASSTSKKNTAKTDKTPSSTKTTTPPASTSPAAGSSTKTAPSQQTAPPKSSSIVWVNTDSRVYHKPGNRWYGKTKQGKYMTEADAIKAGYRSSEKK